MSRNKINRVIAITEAAELVATALDKLCTAYKTYKEYEFKIEDLKCRHAQQLKDLENRRLASVLLHDEKMKILDLFELEIKSIAENETAKRNDFLDASENCRKNMDKILDFVLAERNSDKMKNLLMLYNKQQEEHNQLYIQFCEDNKKMAAALGSLNQRLIAEHSNFAVE